MSLAVRTTPEADEQIRAIDAWWRANHSASPDLFAAELASSFDVINHTPQIGRLYRRSPLTGIRRVLLKGSRYHAYYVAMADGIDVLAVWHGQRGAGPPLRD